MKHGVNFEPEGLEEIQREAGIDAQQTLQEEFGINITLPKEYLPSNVTNIQSHSKYKRPVKTDPTAPEPEPPTKTHA